MLLQVVVPVRETAAQALAAALTPVSIPTLTRVMALLAGMHTHSEWSVRHGAMTGIKYLLATRPDAASLLLPAALPVLLAGLGDRDDSVQAAAAEALIPVAPLLLATPADGVRQPCPVCASAALRPCTHTHIHTRQHALTPDVVWLGVQQYA
jgi:HEAT-like repeat